MKDRNGFVSGRLTVIACGRTENCISKTGNKYTRDYYICRCSCGKELEIAASSLITGSSKSCGCLRKELLMAKREDLSNQRFGRWSTVSPVEGTGNFWNCVCDCGTEKVIKAERLKSGLSKSCGCLQKEHSSRVFSNYNREYRKSVGHDPDIPMTPQREAERNIFKKYYLKETFIRDNYTCALCAKTNCKLNAHHIKPWATNPDGRFDMSNVVTLCLDCHNYAHSGNFNIEPDFNTAILLKGYVLALEDYDNTHYGGLDEYLLSA